ncbi:MAG: ABC transporter ATP-binding protein [Anaerolineae bacterium]
MNSRSRKFISYYKPYLRLFVADMACAFIVSGVALLLPLCTGYITRNVLAENNPDAFNQIIVMGGIMLALVILHTICNLFVDYQGHMMGTLMESEMRRELLDHYQKLSFSFYDDNRTGQLMTRLTNDLFSLSEFYHHGPEDLAIAILKLIGAFVIMFHLNANITLLILAFLPLVIGYAFYFNRRMNIALLAMHERIGDINAQVEDTLAGIRVVKSFTNEQIEQRKFEHENARFVASRRDGYRSEGYFYTGMGLFVQLITLAVIVFGGIAILNRSLDLPDLLTYLLCVGILAEPIQRLVNFARLYQEGTTGFNRFMDIMEIAPDIQDAPQAVEVTTVRGNVQFKEVSFKYREEANFVVKHISPDVKAGEYVALVGSSGVGKTTLCSLIPRFYEVSEGCILIDGKNIKDVTLRSLRRNIGIVQQDVYLFAGTVAENIGYGKPDASDQEVIAAAKQANAHDFIMALPQGYDTDIGQRGVKLSGGQKQRLSIARVFLKNPPILIFDEATSSLDNESERAVRESLEALTNNRTTFVIAHRLSTVRHAQRIIVLTDQGIEEQGTHDELIARGGTYANLYNLQLEL